MMNLKKFAPLWSLYSAFFRVGLFTFGGGYAMLPMLQREVVDRHHWATESELLECYAIAQCTPGVIAVNTATYVGYRQKKISGSICATVGVITPSLIIITLLTVLLSSVREYSVVLHAFAGIRISVCALMANAFIRLFEKGVCGAVPVLIFFLSFAAMLLLPISPVWIVVFSVLLGILLQRTGKTL